jgi:hypothetical protein
MEPELLSPRSLRLNPVSGDASLHVLEITTNEWLQFSRGEEHLSLVQLFTMGVDPFSSHAVGPMCMIGGKID